MERRAEICVIANHNALPWIQHSPTQPLQKMSLKDELFRIYGYIYRSVLPYGKRRKGPVLVPGRLGRGGRGPGSQLFLWSIWRSNNWILTVSSKICGDCLYILMLSK